jgi:hypothetical protein
MPFPFLFISLFNFFFAFLFLLFLMFFLLSFLFFSLPFSSHLIHADPLHLPGPGATIFGSPCAAKCSGHFWRAFGRAPRFVRGAESVEALPKAHPKFISVH